MNYLLKIIEIFIILLIIYLWNKYIIPFLIKKVVSFHKSFTKIDENPAIKFFVKNEQKIINFAQYFYWVGAVIITISILIN